MRGGEAKAGIDEAGFTSSAFRLAASDAGRSEAVTTDRGGKP
jgi:hypothetical protein